MILVTPVFTAGSSCIHLRAPTFVFIHRVSLFCNIFCFYFLTIELWRNSLSRTTKRYTKVRDSLKNNVTKRKLNHKSSSPWQVLKSSKGSGSRKRYPGGCTAAGIRGLIHVEEYWLWFGRVEFELVCSIYLPITSSWYLFPPDSFPCPITVSCALFFCEI